MSRWMLLSHLVLYNNCLALTTCFFQCLLACFYLLRVSTIVCVRLFQGTFISISATLRLSTTEKG